MAQYKTPIMLLQEFTAQKGLPLPHYQIVFETSGTHQNRFDYAVMVAGIKAPAGSASSKKVAKHQAASNALLELEKMGLYVPADSKKGPLKVGTDRNIIQAENLVSRFEGLLRDGNDRNNMPIKNLVSNFEGPLRDGNDTDIYVPASRSEGLLRDGTDKSNPLETASEPFPYLIASSMGSQQQASNEDHEMKKQITKAITKFQEFEEFPVSDQNLNVDELDHTLAKLMRSKNLTNKDFEKDLKIQTQESMYKILDRLEVGHSWVEINKSPIVMRFSLNIKTPFTIWGIGENIEEAKRDAISRSFLILDQQLNIKISNS